MFVRTKLKSSGKTAVQIVENQRIGNKVNQRVVRYVGQASTPEELLELEKLARTMIYEIEERGSQPHLPIFSPEQISSSGCRKKLKLEVKKGVGRDKDFIVDMRDVREVQRVIVGIGDVFGKLFCDLGFDRLLSGSMSKVLMSTVLARISNPCSKLRTVTFLEEDYGIRVSLDSIYRMMDKLSEIEGDVKKVVSDRTKALFYADAYVLFFDVTTLYFESQDEDVLRRHGFSKDGKFSDVQVVLALITTHEGLPITYEVFPGNIFEGHTLINLITKVKEEFNIMDITLVADRAMFSEENLLILEKNSISYVVAAKLKTLPKQVQEQLLNGKNYVAAVVDDEFHWVCEFPYKGRRLIVSYNSDRARKDISDRERLINKLKENIKKNGKLSPNSLVTNKGKHRFITWSNGSCAEIDENKILEDARWDGMHGIISNSKEPFDSALKLLSRYKGLWQIEEAFRVNKHDLKMRPIYHWTEKRIRAHIAICYLAYATVKHALFRLKRQFTPMSFEKLRTHLLHAQVSILHNVKTDKFFVIPSKVTPIQKRIYAVFGLKRDGTPYIKI